MGKRLTNVDLTLQQLEKEITRSKHHRSRSMAIRGTISAMLVVAALVVLTVTLCFPVLEVTDSSMAPLLESGQVVLALRTHEPTPGDITVFYNENQITLRRMIAGAGDWIDIDDTGAVYVNGEMFDESYLQMPVQKPNGLTYPYRVPSDCIFVMSDNRAGPVDSGVSEIGPVQSEQILGKVLLRIWPLNQLSYIG